MPRQAAMTAKWIQIFVRPHRADLKPLVQFAELPELQEGAWRHLAGNEKSSAPALIRNDVDIYDAVAESGELTVPRIEGRHVMAHVWKGTITVDGRHLTAGEGILLAHEDAASIQVHEAAGLLLFHIVPDAPVTHSGTIGN